MALALRELLDDQGLRSFAKTSGAEGLHVYVPLNSDHTYGQTKAFARGMVPPGRRRPSRGRRHGPGRAGREGLRRLEPDDPGKSTIAPYSLRGLRYPTASVPVTREEVDAAVVSASLDGLVFLVDDLLGRVERASDLFAPVLDVVHVIT